MSLAARLLPLGRSDPVACSTSARMSSCAPCRTSRLSRRAHEAHVAVRMPARRRTSRSIVATQATASPAFGPTTDTSVLVQSRGWEVSMLDPREMVLAAELQARAFFQPGAIQALDSFFLYLMRGELVDTLRSKLKYTSANKFAALVVRKGEDAAKPPIAGVVEVSVQRDPEVAAVLGLTEYAYVACMAVDKEHRRNGAASALLSGAEAIGRRWGFREAALHVYVNNEGAKKLYAANGWVERKTDSTLKSILMGKKQRILMSKPLALPPPTSPSL